MTTLRGPNLPTNINELTATWGVMLSGKHVLWVGLCTGTVDCESVPLRRSAVAELGEWFTKIAEEWPE